MLFRTDSTHHRSTLSFSPWFPGDRFAFSPKSWPQLTSPTTKNRQITSDSRLPYFSSNCSPLFSSSLYYSPPAFLCPRGFHAEKHSRCVSSRCVITHRESVGSVLRAGQEKECRWKSGSTVLLAQTSSRTCVVLPSRPCARSRWDPIQLSVGPSSLLSAIWWQ